MFFTLTYIFTHIVLVAKEPKLAMDHAHTLAQNPVPETSILSTTQRVRPTQTDVYLRMQNGKDLT